MMPHIPRSAFHFVNCPLDSWYYFVKLHSFTVRQYQTLPIGFLHCIPHEKTACHVLSIRETIPLLRDLHPLEKFKHPYYLVFDLKFVFSQVKTTYGSRVCPCWAHTRGIVYCRCSASFKVLALIKLSYNLIGNRFEIGNKPYRQRYQQA